MILGRGTMKVRSEQLNTEELISNAGCITMRSTSGLGKSQILFFHYTEMAGSLVFMARVLAFKD